MSKYTIELNNEQVEGLKSTSKALKEISQLLVQMADYLVEPKEEVEDNAFPKKGDDYYYMDTCGVVRNRTCVDLVGDTTDSDIMRIAIGNVFRTREEAEFTVERLKVLAELRKYAKGYKFKKGGNSKWYIYCDIYSRTICIDHVVASNFGYGCVYFADEYDAQLAIDNIGEDRLKKYYFMVEED